MLADHLLWASTTEAARNEAFNIVNGDVFRWSWLWKQLAGWFGVEPIGYDGTIHPLEEEIKQDGPLWQAIARRYGLKEPAWIGWPRLAYRFRFGRPIEVMTDMSKSRKLGLSVFQRTDESFFDLFEQLRTEKLIP